MHWLRSFLVFALLFVCGCYGDKPCIPRSISGESPVCVCNTTYCDTVTRHPPSKGTFVSYTSSRDGLRFIKHVGALRRSRKTDPSDSVTLTLNPKIKYQSIEGFGGAFTDSAGINWRSLPKPLQKHLIRSYFSNEGLEYNMGRVPIGGCDFSTRGYAYNELPVNDTTLSNFTLAYEDYHYKIPMIKAAQSVATAKLHLVGTTWSPPPWMKTNNNLRGNSRLKPEYFQTYADYHYKFIEHYSAAGVPVWGITTTNEPSNGVVGITLLNSLGWTAPSMGRWIVDNLGPTIKNSTFKDVNIIAGDDQRLLLLYWIKHMISIEPEVLKYISGVGVHFYMDYVTPDSFLDSIMESCKGCFLLPTEACEGFQPWVRSKVILGSWDRAYNYVHDIMGDLNNNAVGWIDWNLCLDATGGPNWVNNFVDAPIIVFPKKRVFVKQPMFYALGHFSKFVPRGSQRIQIEETEHTKIERVAFLTPKKTAVVVLYNRGKPTTVNIKLGTQMASLQAEKDSIITVELPYMS